MSAKELTSKVRELKELKAFAEQIADEIAAIEDLIKAEMTVRNTDDLTAGAYRIKWTTYQSRRFDSTRFKKDHAELAAAYTKTTTARRFSIN